MSTTLLAIETSCDETAAAVIKGRRILSDEIASSASVQAQFGGVVPEIASRRHVEAISGVDIIGYLPVTDYFDFVAFVGLGQYYFENKWMYILGCPFYTCIG